MPPGEKCFAAPPTINGFRNYLLSFDVFCDPTINTKPDLKVDETDICNPKISFTHSSGCPSFKGSDLVRYLSHH